MNLITTSEISPLKLTTMQSDALCRELPDRSESDIPLQVRYILSVCEVATGWGDWQESHLKEPRAHFCEGVFDYWWDDDLEEPTWEMIFYKDFESGDLYGMSSVERFSYQQGAILGYQLREEYKYDGTI